MKTPMSSRSDIFASVPPTPEPFVSAQEAAQFLSVKRRYLLELARRGIAGAYRTWHGKQTESLGLSTIGTRRRYRTR